MKASGSGPCLYTCGRLLAVLMLDADQLAILKPQGDGAEKVSGCDVEYPCDGPLESFTQCAVPSFRISVNVF